MDNWFAIDFISRWLHVVTAIVVVGGSVFVRFVLVPAAEGLSPKEHDAFRKRIFDIWRRFVMVGIALFLVTGFFNYYRAIQQYQLGALYHALLGTKILLALAVFFLASALVGRSPALEGIRRSSKTWLLVLILLAAVIVGIGSFLKVLPKQPKVGDGAVASSPA